MTVMVAGALHLDLVIRAPHLPAPDETVPGRSVDYVFGGKGGNQALAAAAMGAPTAFAGRAGTDAFGELLRLRLAHTRVDTSNLQRDRDQSGMSVAIVDDKGDYGAVIVSGANQRIEAEAIALPDDLRLLSLQNEIPEEVNLALARRAKAMGAQVWLNAAPARPLGDALMAFVDLMIVNRVEAAYYGDEPRHPVLLETLGARGVRLGGKTYRSHAVEVQSSHGAGDMFIGALAAEVWRGRDLEAALTFAQGAAALLVSTAPAGREDIDRAAVLAFLEAQASR